MRSRSRKRPQTRELFPSEWGDLDVAQEEQSRSERETAEELFASQCQRFRLPPFQREYRFARAIGRLWRFDFAFHEPYHLAVEIEGLVVRRLAGQLVVMGGHASPAGMIEDMEKYNAALCLGWGVLRFPAKHVKPGHAIDMTQRVLFARGWRRTAETVTGSRT